MRRRRMIVAASAVLTTSCTAYPYAPAVRPEAAAVEPSRNELGELQRRVLVLVNAERRRAGVDALEWHDALGHAAEVHARNMAVRQHVAHTFPGIEQHSLTMRAVHAGYEFTRITENLAAGPRSAEEVVAAWLASPGHRNNILDPAVKESGVAVRRSADGVLYFCQVFGVQHPYASADAVASPR